MDEQQADPPVWPVVTIVGAVIVAGTVFGIWRDSWGEASERSGDALARERRVNLAVYGRPGRPSGRGPKGMKKAQKRAKAEWDRKQARRAAKDTIRVKRDKRGRFVKRA